MEEFILNPAEMTAFQDRSFMPLKSSAWLKVENLLEVLRHGLIEDLAPVRHLFPREMDVSAGKLSRGENYQDFPYRVLDLPRAFQDREFFTFRALVLWGHHISFHLIATGRYKEAIQGRIIAAAASLPDSFNLSAQATPWEWHLNTDDYVQARALQEAPVAQALRENSFLKISFFMPLSRYMDIPVAGREVWRLWQLIIAGEQVPAS